MSRFFFSFRKRDGRVVIERQGWFMDRGNDKRKENLSRFKRNIKGWKTTETTEF